MNILCDVIFPEFLAVFGIPAPVFWPYFATVALTVVALALIVGRELPQARGMDKAVVFGRLFLAVPMAAFGVEHYMFWREMGPMVPSWIPWHPFWLLLVGTGLIAASVSIVAKQYDVLAASLLGAMIFSFVLLIHIPAAITSHGDRFRVAVALRDTSFSAGALAYAVARAQQSRHALQRVMLRLVRYVIGVVWVVFGVEHFLHPQNVPVVPLEKLLPAWIPGHVPLAIVTGAMLIVCGGAVVFNWKARFAATWMGIYSAAVVLLVYLPLLIAKPNVGEGLNYLADTMVFSGCALALAQALPNDTPTSQTMAERAEAGPNIGLHEGGVV